ncbi:ATP-binding protein [Streptomyces sp. NPDC056653]|uniref:ATP-binding protein n=1 Tax=Streptomyces sp. NPDC056653 TaxID=3345894 RepID=UPI003682F812
MGHSRDTAPDPYNARTTKVGTRTPPRTITTEYGHHAWSAPHAPTHDGTVKHQAITPEPRPTVPEFNLRLSSTRRGARLARTLAVQQLTEWCGIPHDSDSARTVALVTAELASNAISHGHLPGREFRLTLLLLPHGFRVEVTDTRPERLPQPVMPQPAYETSGRGLLLVQAYADRWGYKIRDAYTKTVWAEISTQGHAPAKADHRPHETEQVSRRSTGPVVPESADPELGQAPP